jgi:hypothetical protein
MLHTQNKKLIKGGPRVDTPGRDLRPCTYMEAAFRGGSRGGEGGAIALPFSINHTHFNSGAA